MRLACIVLALVAALSFGGTQLILQDGDLHYPTVTEDWTEYYAGNEGWFGVSSTGNQVTADTLEFFCDLPASAETRGIGRIWFYDTDGTSGLLKLLISTDATRDSLGTGLTEYKVYEFNGGTISSAWYTGVTGTNGTVIYSTQIPQSTWFDIPEFGFNADYRIGLVCADTTTVNLEWRWSEEE